MKISGILNILSSRLLRLLAAATVRRGPAKGILLLASGGIGDNVMLSWVIAPFLDLAETGEPVTLLMRSDSRPIAFLFPPSLQVDYYDWKKFRRRFAYRLTFCRKIRARQYRLAISTDYDRHPFVDELILATSGSRTIVEAARPSRTMEGALKRNRKLFDRVIDHPPAGHRLTRWTRLASALSGRLQTIPPIGPAGPPLRRDNTVILHPFVSDPRRQVPPGIFLAVISALPAACDIRLSVGPGDL